MLISDYIQNSIPSSCLGFLPDGLGKEIPNSTGKIFSCLERELG